ESVGQEVLTRFRHRVDALARAVMVREHEAVARNEGRRTAGDPRRGEAYAIEPRLVGMEVVALGPVCERRSVERPHLPGFEPGIFRSGRLLRGERRSGTDQQGDENEPKLTTHRFPQ